MGSVMILNGSPRAPRSNSRRCGELFAASYPGAVESWAVTGADPGELCRRMEDFSDVLLIFPLYADAIPVPLLRFLKEWQAHPPKVRPTVSVLINCGFLEPAQNETAVRMIRLFCQRNGCPFGSVLMIGSGEAILDSPFRFLAAGKIRRLAKDVARGGGGVFSVTMPLTRRLFVRAAASYWTGCGKKHGVTKEQMETLQIE